MKQTKGKCANESIKKAFMPIESVWVQIFSPLFAYCISIYCELIRRVPSSFNGQ